MEKIRRSLIAIFVIFAVFVTVNLDNEGKNTFNSLAEMKAFSLIYSIVLWLFLFIILNQYPISSINSISLPFLII